MTITVFTTSAEAKILAAVPSPIGNFVREYTDAALSLGINTNSIAFAPKVVRAVHALYGSSPDQFSTLMISEFLKAVKRLDYKGEWYAIDAVTSKEAVDLIKSDCPRQGLGRNNQFTEYVLGLAYIAMLRNAQSEMEKSAEAKILAIVPSASGDFVTKYTDAALSLWTNITSIAFEPDVVKAVHELYSSLSEPPSLILEYLTAVRMLEREHEPDAIKALASKDVVDCIKDDYPRLGPGYTYHMEYMITLAHGAPLGDAQTGMETGKCGYKPLIIGGSTITES